MPIPKAPAKFELTVQLVNDEPVKEAIKEAPKEAAPKEEKKAEAKKPEVKKPEIKKPAPKPKVQPQDKIAPAKGPVKLMGKVKKATEEEVAVVNAKDAENSALSIAEAKLEGNPLDSFADKAEPLNNAQSLI